MKLHRLFQAVATAGVTAFIMAASASANPITYNTNGAGTHFNAGVNLFLNSTGGTQASTLTFAPNPSGSTGVPSGINYGDFTLTCTTCTTTLGATYGAFTFSLQVTDVTDGGSGTFIGTSPGGSVFSNTSGLIISWAPLSLGPFGPTTFSMIAPVSVIVAPNSGTPLGYTSVQGLVTSSAVPEPSTFALLGAALFGLGVVRRKRATR